MRMNPGGTPEDPDEGRANPRGESAEHDGSRRSAGTRSAGTRQETGPVSAMTFRFGSFQTDVYIWNESFRFRYAQMIGRLPASVSVFDAHTIRLIENRRPIGESIEAHDEGARPAAEPQESGGSASASREVRGEHARVMLEPGERAKSWDSVASIYERAVEAGLGRDGSIVGVGGGVIGDVAAFAASTYMRGCGLVLFPTTLLAMVDASLGGKTGINFAGYKNMVGTFYPAGEIHIVPGALATLSEREYRSGLAEVVKSALLGEPSLLELLESRPDEVLAREAPEIMSMVERSLRVKGEIVEHDFTEGGRRAHLNLGHTFAHALESVAGFGSVTHGEAVAWGIAQALRAGERAGITDPAYTVRVLRLLERYGFADTLDALPEATGEVSADSLVSAMQHDKKVKGGAIRFVLQESLGRTRVQELPLDDVRRLLSER